MISCRRTLIATAAAMVSVALFTAPAAAAEPFVLVDDAYQTPVGQQLVVAVPGFLGNDTLPSDVFGFQDSGDAPDHGAIDLHDGGAFEYTPDAGFRGVDTFKYGVHDNTTNVEKKATVTITVGGPAPVAVADSYDTDAGVALTKAAPGVRGNDTGPGTTTQVGTATNGSVTLAGDGGFTFTPAANFAGIATFQYKIVDLTATHDSSTVTVTITVHAVEFNPGPTAAISGTARIGSTLTAGEGSASPTPDSYEYQWYANGVAIGGATNQTFTLTSAQVGKAITVKVTAKKAGITEASDLSDPTPLVSSLTAKHLELETSSSTYAGNTLTVKIEKLAKGEAYTIRIDDVVVKTGVASSEGKVSTTVKVPLTIAAGSHTITGFGAFEDRFDDDALTLKSPSDPDVELKSSVKKGGTQTIHVEGLLKGEAVRVRYDNATVSPSGATANSSGEYTLSFNVGTTVGTHSVKVTGLYDGRNKTKTFKVTN